MKFKNLISKTGKGIAGPKSLLFGLGLVGFLCCANSAEAQIINVPADFPTIQEGIDNAQYGNTVKVAPGIYIENIILKSGIVVQGSGADSTILKDAYPPGDLVSGGDSTSIFEGFKVVGDSTNPGWGYSSSVMGNSPILRKNVFTNLFVGVECGQNLESRVKVLNNTIINCERGIGYGWNAEPTIENNIIVGSDLGIYHYGPGDSLTFVRIEYNNIWNNTTNYASWPDSLPDQTGINGNISEDPLFVDFANGDYHLQSISPCIDAGNPNFIYNDPDGTRNDIGAFYYQIPTIVEEKIIENKVKDIQAYPNPFAQDIKFYQDNGNLEAKIYDAAGRFIKKCNEGVWDGKDEKGNEMPSGNYFGKVKEKISGNVQEYTLKVIKISN